MCVFLPKWQPRHALPCPREKTPAGTLQLHPNSQAKMLGCSFCCTCRQHRGIGRSTRLCTLLDMIIIHTPTSSKHHWQLTLKRMHAYIPDCVLRFLPLHLSSHKLFLLPEAPDSVPRPFPPPMYISPPQLPWSGSYPPVSSHM